MVLVGEDEQFGGHASQFRRIECRHALRGEDAEILFAVDAEDRRVPFVYEKVRRIGVAALHGRVVLFPIRAAQVPVGEPKLFGFQVLLLHVEESVVCDECLEAFVVMSGKPVHRIASEAGSYASQPVFVYVRFLRDVVYRAQVIIHAMSAVVGADFFQPFHAEARQSAAVGSDDDVIVSRHNLQVPAVAPELADGALRSAFAEEEGRVFLVRVEIDGIDHPRKHVLAVYRLGPARFYLAFLQLAEDMVVLRSDAGHFVVFLQVDSEEFVGFA